MNRTLTNSTYCKLVLSIRIKPCLLWGQCLVFIQLSATAFCGVSRPILPRIRSDHRAQLPLTLLAHHGGPAKQPPLPGPPRSWRHPVAGRPASRVRARWALRVVRPPRGASPARDGVRARGSLFCHEKALFAPRALSAPCWCCCVPLIECRSLCCRWLAAGRDEGGRAEEAAGRQPALRRLHRPDGTRAGFVPGWVLGFGHAPHVAVYLFCVC